MITVFPETHFPFPKGINIQREQKTRTELTHVPFLQDFPRMVTVSFTILKAPAVLQQRSYLYTATQAEIFLVESPTGRQSTYVSGNKKTTFPPFLGSTKTDRGKKNSYTTPTPNSFYFSQILSGK